MIRRCDGTDETLLRESVNPQTEERAWRPCDCGTQFDDVERTTIYPHRFIRADKERLAALVEQGLTADQIHEQLTAHPELNYSQGNQPRDERTPVMGEGNDFQTEQNPGYGQAPDAAVDTHADESDSAEATEGTESVDADEASDSEGTKVE